jgi:glycosyltransferase involved in cell wall biosynthesis
MGSFPLYKALSGEEVEQDRPVVLFFGRIRAYKGLDVLVRAAPMIAASIPNVRIIIAGAGDCDIANKATVEQPELFEIYNHHIRADKVPGLFQRSAVVVLPYLDATQSAVASLACLFGKPVVASHVGSIPEIVEDGKTGLLVPRGDEYSLAEAVVMLLEEPKKRKEMGKAAAAKIEEELSWDSISTKTLAVYHRACKVDQSNGEASETLRW